MRKRTTSLCLLAAAISITACTTTSRTSVSDIMPVPAFIEATDWDPYATLPLGEPRGAMGILYATNRRPIYDDHLSYSNQRDEFLNLGLARIAVGRSPDSREDLPDIDDLSDRDRSFPLSVVELNSFGPLAASYPSFAQPEILPDDPTSPGSLFASMVNRQLEGNPVREITIFVHGYNTSFENPLIVAAEMWHYMGYQGVFLAYSWPSAQSFLNYSVDIQTAEHSSLAFRTFLEFLSAQTQAERINIIAFSAGTRLVSQSLYQLALIYRNHSRQEARGATKIGRVAFVAGDVERRLLALYVDDGMLRPLDSLAIYMSETDLALNASSMVNSANRVGQSLPDDLNDDVLTFLHGLDDLELIDVSGSQHSRSRIGHEYFRESPWVSSDLLLSLYFDLHPFERGLIRPRERSYWSFPEDYPQRLEILPGLPVSRN